MMCGLWVLGGSRFGRVVFGGVELVSEFVWFSGVGCDWFGGWGWVCVVFDDALPYDPALNR